MSSQNTNEQNGPLILGDLEPMEVQRLAGLRQQSERAVYQLGHITLSMFRQYRNIEVLEQQAQALLNGVGERLNIPHGTAWSVTGDGKAVLVDQPPQTATPTPPADEGSEEG